MPEKEQENSPKKRQNGHATDYVLDGITIATITYPAILSNTSPETLVAIGSSYDIYPAYITVDQGLFASSANYAQKQDIKVVQQNNSIWLSCGCNAIKTKLCAHQAQVLQALMNRPELRVFFDTKQRHHKIKTIAQDYGLAEAENLDEYFVLEYSNKTIDIKPKLKELLPVNPQTQAYLQAELLPKLKLPGLPPYNTLPEKSRLIVVFTEHKYYKHLFIELYQATITHDGKLKNPLQNISPADLTWLTDDPVEIKFYNAISKFQTNHQTTPAEVDIVALKALVKNPLGLSFYRHQSKNAENITARSVVPIQLQYLPVNLELEVQLKDEFYQVTGSLTLNDVSTDLRKLQIMHGYFILVKNLWYLVDDPDMWRVIQFFKKRDHKIIVHESKFKEFRETILINLEHKIKINYAFVKPATEKQIEDYGFDESREPIIYLSESEDFILITPVMRYGPLEIPVLSKKQIFATDARGNAFTLTRDEEAENNLVADILKQHSFFYEQLHLDCFYLHRERFLDQGWFLNAFEAWNKENITILGFKELKNNNLNPHKAIINIKVTSGLNWFDTAVDVQFGQQKATLKYLHKAIRNKNQFVQLSDGTLGMLPEEWVEKFANYFEAGEVAGEKIRTPKINFSTLNELYEAEVLSQEVKTELALYRDNLNNFEALPEAEVPFELQATLRPYQMQGLNWLHFLDQFNFGGCLADDMGLGKTLQVLAFILSQRRTKKANCNLVVVPTSLLFNWQEEVAKFAPSLKLTTLYGTNRLKKISELKHYELVLTSYGTLVSDIQYLKEYTFNYIFLDESQHIKNPESQRYQAARLLQSRNKVVLTGTPIENNTFDLYGQLSFACPGLLGSKRYFRDHYSTPIDKFKNSRRADELQAKVRPFILRRTKEQVARDLPDKTEMVIYTQMGPEQRRVYEAAKNEISNYISAHGEGEIKKNSMHVLRGLTKLRQICDSPALLPNGDFNVTASAKIETLLEQIESKVSYHKILIFSQFVSMLELIQNELIKRDISFSLLTGKTRDRAGAVNSFQEDETVRVFLISLKAGGTGLNLTRADYVYLVDPWWNPAVENQAIDRTYRIGQVKNVIAVRLICPDTVEEKMMKLQEVKKELVQDIIKTDNAILKSLSKQDLLALFD